LLLEIANKQTNEQKKWTEGLMPFKKKSDLQMKCVDDTKHRMILG